MISEWELVGRLLFAAVLGSAIGLERERLSWAAGLRTHMLVCVGSALIMIVSTYGFTDMLAQEHVALDPSRVAAQVVSGIGFLGAGAIIARGEVVRGLTTAASVWSVAAIGLAVGGGLYTPAIAATIIILIILAGIKPIERRFITNKLRRRLLISVERGSLPLARLHELLGTDSARVEQFITQPSEEDPEFDDISIVLTRVPPQEFAAIRQRLQSFAGLRHLKEIDGL
ncbi:MAG: MgtC/SapB family protein [Burkholderiales bacterium]|nr:MgtC/SapB family protein [Burkholderiales bacterium]